MVNGAVHEWRKPWTKWRFQWKHILQMGYFPTCLIVNFLCRSACPQTFSHVLGRVLDPFRPAERTSRPCASLKNSPTISGRIRSEKSRPTGQRPTIRVPNNVPWKTFSCFIYHKLQKLGPAWQGLTSGMPSLQILKARALAPTNCKLWRSDDDDGSRSRKTTGI